MISGALQSLRGAVRLEGFDSLTAAGRSRERYRRVALATLAAATARSMTILTGLITVALAVRYLGNEQYGLLITITSFAAFLTWADLGIGNGVVSALSRRLALGDRDAAQELVSSAFFVLLGLSLVLLLVFAVVEPLIPWSDVFNVSSSASVDEAEPAAVVFVVLSFVAVPLAVAQRAQLGMQESFRASLWTGAGAAFGLIGLVVAILAGASLPAIVAATTGGPVLALALNSVSLYWKRDPWLRPSLRAFHPGVAFGVVRTGLLFLVLQVAMAVAYESDALVIAQILGPASVTTFSVTFKLFMVGPMLLGFALMPLWPAYADAVARADGAWVDRTLRRALKLSLATAVPISLLLLVLGVPLIHLWAGDSITPSTGLRLALATWAILVGLSGVLAVLLNGVGAMRFQATCAAVMMIANILLSIAFTRAVGISGVVLGSIVAQTVFVLVPGAIYARRLLERIA